MDEVYVNGFLVGTLSGANDQWSINTFEFPLSHLLLPTAANPDGRNEFWVDIDTTNNGWAVEVDWAALRLTEDFVPLTFVHGFTSSGDGWADFRSFILDNLVLAADEMASPTHSSTNIESGTAEITAPVDDLLFDTGAHHTNMIAHSYGGLVARMYAWDNPSEVDNLILVGAPNGGMAIADAVCLFKNSNGPWAGILWGAELFDDELGDCHGPENGLFQLQTDYVQNVFNKQILDRNGTEYLVISGSLPDDGRLFDLIPGPDDGMVSQDSSEYLLDDRPDHPGKHEKLAVLPTEHGELILESSLAMPVSVCRLYGEQCEFPLSATQQANLSGAEDIVFSWFDGIQVPPASAGSIDLQFEGAPEASVVLISDHIDSISPSFPGATFEPAKLIAADVLATSVESPADGQLPITNSGTETASVIALVGIPSGRSLDVQASDTLIEPSTSVGISVTLAEAGLAESVEAEVRTPSGSASVVTITETTPGTWTGNITATEPGLHTVSAWVGGPRPRFASTLLSVASGQAQLTGAYAERLEGDADGLADTLVVSPEVSVGAAGRYRISAELADAAGTVIASGGGVADLPSGTSSVDVTFEGRSIFDSGVDGPYRIVNVALSRDDLGLLPEDEVAFLGVTQSYSHDEFDHFPVAFDLDAFSDEAVDLDADGTDDELRVHGTVSVDIAGSYAVNARLLAPDRTEVAEFQTVAGLVVGSNQFTLTFDGDDIAMAGKDGPFLVEDLSVYPTSDDDLLGYLVRAHETASYTAAQFTAPAWSSPDVVNDVVTNFQLNPSLALGPGGAAYAAWEDRRNNGDHDIYFSKRDPTTGAWSANERVNNVTVQTQDEPAIAVDAAGNAYAVWTDTRNGTTDHDIYFSKRSASTGSWSPSVRVNDDGAGKRQDFPSIAVTPSGDAVAVWRDQRGGGNKKNIYSARLPAGSSTWSANLKVTTESNAHKEEPHVALGTNGAAYALWADQRNSGSQDIWFASLASGSSTWSANAQISEPPNGGKEDPAIGVDTAGNLLAVWDSGSIQARRRPAGSSTWDPTVVIGGSNVNLPSISVRGDGRAFAAWFEGTPSTLTTVSVSEFDPDSSAWTSPELLSDPANEAGAPSIAVDASQVIVLYHGRPAGGSYDVYAIRKAL